MTRETCRGKTQKGKPCQAKRKAGTLYCAKHQVDGEPVNMGGAPSKLSLELVAAIVGLVREGHYIETVCKAVGISKPTYYAWRERGEAALLHGDDGSLEGQFLYALKRAEGDAEIDALRQVRMAGANWQAHMTYLERRFRARWSRAEIRVGEDGGQAPPSPEEIDVTTLSSDDLRSLRDIYARAREATS